MLGSKPAHHSSGGKHAASPTVFRAEYDKNHAKPRLSTPGPHLSKNANNTLPSFAVMSIERASQ